LQSIPPPEFHKGGGGQWLSNAKQTVLAELQRGEDKQGQQNPQ
jgi:hypothetical protein